MHYDEKSFCFVARGTDAAGTIRSVQLEISPQDDKTVTYLRQVWMKMYGALKGYHDCCSSVAPGWTRWNLDGWSTQKVPDRQKFAAWAGDTLVGILNLRADYPSQYEPGKKLIYIEHIATAPGNIATDIWGLRLTHVGSALMAYAVFQSLMQGFEGRIGLHAADDVAAAYYTHLAQKRRLLREALRGISGVPENKRAHELNYFESDRAAAVEFLEGYYNA